MEETEEYIILQDRDEEGNVGIYGLWIFSEAEPSSTAGTRELVARVIADCAARAGDTRTAAKAGATGNEAGMVREVSNKSGQVSSKQQQQGPIEVAPPNTYAPNVPIQPQPRQPPRTSRTSQPEGGDVLGDLFRKAGLNYRGA